MENKLSELVQVWNKDQSILKIQSILSDYFDQTEEVRSLIAGVKMPAYQPSFDVEIRGDDIFVKWPRFGEEKIDVAEVDNFDFDKYLEQEKETMIKYHKDLILTLTQDINEEWKEIERIEKL